MNFIFFLYYIVLVSKLCFSKPHYSGPGYNNDRESDNSAMASHQKIKLLSDDTLQMQEAPSSYNIQNRYRKYQPSDSQYIHRDARLDHDQPDFEASDGKESRDYNNNNSPSKDSSIEIILDPRAKKAVAVVENSPNGQAMYDLSGWKNSEAQDNQEQVVNLVYPAERSTNEKIQRKYNADGYETGKYADNYEGSDTNYQAPVASKSEMRERLVDSSEQIIKKKRNAEISKLQMNAPDAKIDGNLVKRSAGVEKRKTDSQLTKTDEKQNDCPPHGQPQKCDKSLGPAKRETQHWSQEQISAVHNSIIKANEDHSEMIKLKAMLSEMGLGAENIQKRDVNEKPNEETKREAEAETSEFNEDDDEDKTMLKRNDRALSDDEKWEMDVNSAPQEPIAKRDLKDLKDDKEEDLDKKRANEDILKEDLDDLSLLDNNDRKKRQNIDKKEETAKIIETNVDTKKEKRKLDDADYDKQMENEIQVKIDAIKEKVKRDIFEDQKRKRAKRLINSNGGGDASNFKANYRIRRNINTENDEKSSKLNVRKKRANNMVKEKQMIYRPFQADQDEETELDGEFDDNKIYLQKRQAGADDDWQYLDSRDRELSPYAQSYYPQSRNRRSFDSDYVEDSAPFHDGGMVNNKASMKTRNKFRENFADQQGQDTPDANEINDSEYFGSLPFSYNGELTRYKRIKRDNPYK